MLTKYSKPPADVAAHTARLLADNAKLLARQQKIARGLNTAPQRTMCLLCAAPLSGAVFGHRATAYRRCDACGHVQSVHKPWHGYPYSEQDFADIYRPLDPTAYASRTARIYAPKLDWILRAGRDAGLGDLLSRSWLEIGSGAGNFIAALRTEGGKNVAGLESELPLVEEASGHLGVPLVKPFSGTLAEAVRAHSADIYVAWFVLEHCNDLPEFLDAMRSKPKGTIFAFSVPVYGLATLIEGALAGHYARGLDGVLHVQLFTDRSIAYAMQRAGYDIRAEWLFGQDADDLFRAVAAHIGEEEAAAFGLELDRLSGALPAIQQAVDRARLSDSRHVLAVRT
jgi:2-polyprenyl-3-methyl-5-hydroxy-6-metoxy-1,4-benzoquinol methylase